MKWAILSTPMDLYLHQCNGSQYATMLHPRIMIVHVMALEELNQLLDQVVEFIFLTQVYIG